MISLLLIISFLLHIVSITAIYQLTKQVNHIKTSTTSEIDTLLSSHLKEIKNENNKLQQQLTKRTSKEPIKPNKLHQESEKESSQPLSFYNYTDNPGTPKIEKTDILKKDSEQAEVFESSIEGSVYQLYDQGLSITEIAQKLNIGKTEVSLIIDLNKREDH